MDGSLSLRARASLVAASASLALSILGCPSTPETTADAGHDATAVDARDEALLDAARPDAPPPDAFGVASFRARCSYVNPFSERPECREYRGPGWGAESAATDCMRAFGTTAGTLEIGEECAFEDAVGRCTVGDVDAGGYSVLSSGPPSSCGAAQAACETFARGTWTPDARCMGCEASGEIDPNVFIPPTIDCRPAREGEPPGRTDGLVCTPTLISGSTEEGRQYADYADCDVVRTQRPYSPYDLEIPLDPTDPRLLDTSYMTEVGWMRSQAEASACACCHQSSRTPEGAAIWDTEAGPLWIDTISDQALAMLGGYTNSAEFGFYPAAENNGFDRSRSGLPTTDLPRLRAFVALELERRGLTTDEASALPPFAPFFRELVEYVPSPCGPELGLQPDGTLAWTGGAARYVSVLEEGSASPGVPPNFDLPEGTLWSITVPPSSPALGCGMAYGELPAGAIQRIPTSGAPAPLVSGRTYYLHVQRDIALPITRCTFVAP
ncbi:MAG: proteinase inhibitor [Deltaproteobacteria bacterium]|nr:proteinase inhibitor [Deltaproteobacteria bacterium]